MIGLLRSEWIKTSSTRSPYWLLAIALALSLFFAFLVARFLTSDDPNGVMIDPGSAEAIWSALEGYTLFGVLLIWIVGIISVTGEYRFGTVRPAFLAEPTRWRTMLAKALFNVALAAGAAFVILVASLALAEVVKTTGDLDPFSSAGMDALWRLPVYTAIGMFAALGLGYLMRNSAGAIVVLLLWSTVVENLSSLIPRFGPDIAEWMPFANGEYWMKQGVMSGTYIEWSETTGLLLYIGVAAAIFLAGAASTQFRDA